MSDHNAPSVGIVIVSYNTAALLCDCLQSLQHCALPLHVIVVDNASHDDSNARVQAFFPHVQLCALNENRGFAAATNVGLRLLGFGTERPPTVDYALLLNPDTRVHPGALETLVAFLQAHPRVGVVAPRLHNPDGSIQAAAFRFPTLLMSLLDLFPPGEVLPGRLYGSWWHGRYPQEQTGDTPFPIDHPLGACMLVRHSTIEATGLLDEQFFMYSEEVDWCWRIRQAGWAIWQEPHAHVTHVGGASTSQFRHQMLIALHRSRLRFFCRHYGEAFVTAHRALVQAGMLRAVLLAWRDYQRRRIGRDELRRRLWAYGQVMKMMKESPDCER